MEMKQEELISKYFEREMTSAEEQNFLISLAASDAMRIAFRSHLELAKAIGRDKDDLRSTAQVRNRTLAALGLSAAASAPFIEQHLVSSSGKGIAQTATIKPGHFSFLKGLLRSPRFAMGGGLMLGFVSAFGVVQLEQNSSPVHTPVRIISGPHRAASQPNELRPIGTPNKTQVSTTHETIANKNVLNKAEHTTARQAFATRPVKLPNTSSAAEQLPEVNKSVPGVVTSEKVKISKPDSGNVVK